MSLSIRVALVSDASVIQSIAVAAEMFTEEESGFLGEMLGVAQTPGHEEAHWLVAETDGEVVAAAHYAPEPFADRMWNLYFIAVAPPHQSKGLGAQLMAHVEDNLRNRGPDEARTLVVETSSTEKYRRTRAFYQRLGYDEEATIRQFYGPEDHKVVFWKSLV